MVDGNRPETKHDGQMVYWPSLSEWYLVRVQSVPHVSQVDTFGAGVSATEASAILVASSDVVGFVERDVDM
jgi:type IV secretory pathway TrbF-like protein